MKHAFSSVRRGLILTGLVLASALAVPAAQAGTATGTIASSVTLNSDCQMSVNPLAFGTVSALATTSSIQSSLSVTCSTSTAYTISMGIGTTPGSATHGGIPSRFAIDPAGDIIGYGIFRDSAHSNPWGSGTLVVTGTGTGASQTIPVYGTLSIPTGVPAATYTDTVTVVLAY